MSDPRRLREDDPISDVLLGAAQSWRPPEETRRRTLQALGLPFAAGLASAAPAAAAGTGFGVKAWVVVSALTVVGGGGAATYSAMTRLTSEKLPKTVAEAKMTRPPVTAPPAGAPSVARPPVAPAPDIALALAPSPSLPSSSHRPSAASVPTTARTVVVPPAAAPEMPAPAAAPSAVPPRRPPLAGEVRLLDAADQAVTGRAFGRALETLAEYARLFPAGALEEEAAVLGIAARLGAGDRAGAAASGTSFLERHPRSVLASRVRSLLSNEGDVP